MMFPRSLSLLLVLGLSPLNVAPQIIGTESGDAATLLPPPLVSMGRAVDLSTQTSCNFTGKLVFGKPASLDMEAKYFTFGQIQTSVDSLFADFINEHRCGIHMSTGNYAIELRYMDDQSSKTVTGSIGEKLVSSQDVDFIMAGYSSGLTLPLTEVVVDQYQRMLIACCASNPTIYENRKWNFGISPNARRFHQTALQAYAKAGAKTVVTLMEDYSTHMTACGAVKDIAKDLGMQVISDNLVGSSPNATVLNPLAEQFADLDPDVVITCIYDCTPWVQAMRRVNWSPKGHSSSICIGHERFQDGVGTDVEYFAGPSPWNPTVQAMDAITGWTSQEFSDFFVRESSHLAAPYQSAEQAAAFSVLIQAIEKTDSLNEEVLIEYISNNAFQTTLGEVAFDEHGQNIKAHKMVQYDANGVVQTVSPDDIASGPVLYPMPTWDQRDCKHISPCGSSNETSCSRTGQCICSDPTKVSVGIGANAACNYKENMNYIPDVLLAIGYALFGVLMVSALGAGVWTWKNQDKWIVKASQPGLLFIIIVGCAISAQSILFMGIQTDYRELRDLESYLPVGEENPDIAMVDASCMAVPWLYGIGFSIAFSALFAKVERVRLINQASKTDKEKNGTSIGLVHVIHIMALMLAVEAGLLTTWQISSPLRWAREITEEDNGFPVESMGSCTSEYGGEFALALLVFHILSLLYAVILCYRTRHIDDDFAESDSISQAVAFMFQTLTLAVPIAVLVEENNDIFYFVVLVAVFLQNFMMLALIFVPKMIKNANGQGDGQTNAKKESIPMAALTHSKWDEGVDLIHGLMDDESDPLTQEQREKLVLIKSLLLKGHKKMSRKEEKLSHIPTVLMQKNSKSNKFIMEQFGGINESDLSDDQSTSNSLSTNSFLLRKGTSARPMDNMDFGLSEKDEGVHYVLPEFQALSQTQKERVFEMLSLSSLGTWGFDMFNLVHVSGGNPLLLVGWALLGSPHSQVAMAKACGRKSPDGTFQMGYHFADDKTLQIPMKTLCDYLRVIENDYQANPYHNATHAADVLQSLHSLIRMMEPSLAPTKEDLLSILLAAVVHDVGHPGRNNAFQNNATTGLALTYNNSAILENHHVSHAFRTMLCIGPSNDECRPNDISATPKDLNVLQNLKKKQFDSVRDKMIEAIMNTDMSKHFQFVTTMKALALSWQQKDFGGDYGAPKNEAKESVWQILLFLLHMADISGQAKPGKLFLMWSERVNEEFFQQGDEEAKLGMPISHLCNRHTVNVAESQKGFINFVVKPAFEVLGQLLPKVNRIVLPIIDDNLDYWEQWHIHQKLAESERSSEQAPKVDDGRMEQARTGRVSFAKG